MNADKGEWKAASFQRWHSDLGLFSVFHSGGVWLASRSLARDKRNEHDDLGQHTTLEAAQAACDARLLELEAGHLAVCTRGAEQLEACR